MNIQGKHTIELNFAGGHTYLNFWDYMHGNDVIAEIVNGKLFQEQNEVSTEITFGDYVEQVKRSIKQRKKL